MISVGVIGLGYWGPNLVRNIAASPRCRLGWLCDGNPVRLAELGRQYPSARCASDVTDLFHDSELDAVAIATPVGTHYDLVKRALNNGKHVLVEKPLAASVAQAEELVELARQHQRVLLVDHVFLYSPAVRRIAQLIQEGEMGDILFIDSVRINLGLLQHDVNVLWDLAPHDLSIIDYLLGSEPRGVCAVGSSHTANGSEDVAYLHLDYDNNVLASLHVNWLSPVKVRHFLIGGSQRSVLYNDLDLSERVKVYDRGIDVRADPEGIRQTLISYRSGDVVSPRLDATEPLLNLINHLAECIEQSTAPISGGDQGLRVVRVLAAAEQSLRQGGNRVSIS